LERVNEHRLRAHAGSGHRSRRLRRADQEAKPQSQIRVAAPARDGNEGVNRDRKISETEQPEYSGGPSRLHREFEDANNRTKTDGATKHFSAKIDSRFDRPLPRLLESRIYKSPSRDV
jgi:hypothetical protein